MRRVDFLSFVRRVDFLLRRDIDNELVVGSYCYALAILHEARPTPVQRYTIPVGLLGRDVMCCA